MPGSAGNTFVLLPMLAAGLMGQVVSAPPAGYPDPGSATLEKRTTDLRRTPPCFVSSDNAAALRGLCAENLEQIAHELNTAVDIYVSDLSDAIIRFDRGAQPARAPVVQAADADIASSPAEPMWAAVRRLMAFRLSIAREAGLFRPGQQPKALEDMDDVQALVLEARRRVDASAIALRRMLVVPAKDLAKNKVELARSKREHSRFLKAREMATNAAIVALTVLPINHQGNGAAADRARRIWDRLGQNDASQNDASQNDPSRNDPSKDGAIELPGEQSFSSIPLRFHSRTRVTVVREPSMRIAITDSGTVDDQGRHIFYQEEWLERSNVILRHRWRVAVDPETGQHILLRRYPVVELGGQLKDVYEGQDRNYLWSVEPPKGGHGPAIGDVESALARVSRSETAISNAAQDFRDRVRDALSQQDQEQTLGEQPLVDSTLPTYLRMTLFAIRAHMAGVRQVIDGENAVQSAIVNAEQSIRELEPLIAWGNKQDVPGAPVPAAWTQLMERADHVIDFVRMTEEQGRGVLPPQNLKSEDRLTTLAKNTIIRIRDERSPDVQDSIVRYLEEVWRFDYAPSGAREVRRDASLIDVNRRTGLQVPDRFSTVTYKAYSGEPLDSVFDEYSGDQMDLGGGLKTAAFTSAESQARRHP
jgi:hypothetical protein